MATPLPTALEEFRGGESVEQSFYKRVSQPYKAVCDPTTLLGIPYRAAFHERIHTGTIRFLAIRLWRRLPKVKSRNICGSAPVELPRAGWHARCQALSASRKAVIGCSGRTEDADDEGTI